MKSVQTDKESGLLLHLPPIYWILNTQQRISLSKYSAVCSLSMTQSYTKKRYLPREPSGVQVGLKAVDP